MMIIIAMIIIAVLAMISLFINVNMIMIRLAYERYIRAFVRLWMGSWTPGSRTFTLF